MMQNWPMEIVRLVEIKQALADVDTVPLFEFHLPEVGATDDKLAEAEEALGFSLPKEYREFLRFSDGWRSFYQTVDLFGTSDLRGGERMDCATKLLAATADAVVKGSNLTISQLLPIAVTLTDMDLFVAERSTGQVIWLAGGEIDRYPTFDDYYLAMVEYNKQEIEICRRQK